MATNQGSFVTDLLQQHGLDAEVVEAFKKNKITRDNIEKDDDWSHEKLQRMDIHAEGDRKRILDMITDLQRKINISKPKRSPKVFQDPLYGPIELHPLLVKIIDTPQFQRLRDIKQLGGVYYVYPGASHNRFEHSIGVCYLAGVFVENIHDKQPELGIDERDVLCVKIAALCHDMGHGPFSHLFQDLFNPHFQLQADPKLKWRHEEASKKLLDYLVRDNADVHDRLGEYGLDWERDYPFICELITGKRSEGSHEKSFLYQIVANDISCVDVDKMDYIARDCFALGIKLNFDWKRYILFSRVIKNKKGEYHICPREKEVISLYGLFYIRNYLFRVAYQHKTKRAVEFMINDALVSANDHITIPGNNDRDVKLSEATEDMVAFSKLTDSILYQIKCSSSRELKESRNLLKRVDRRQLYSFVTSSVLKPSPPNTPMPVSCANPIKQEENEESEDEEKEEAPQPINMISTQTSEVPLRPNDEGIKEGIAKNGIEAFPELNEQDILDAILIDWVTFDYGKKEDNPIDKLYFYRKQASNTAVPVKGPQRSHMFPSVFQESECRIYSKSNDSNIRKAIRNGFVQFCQTEGHSFEIPLGEKEEGDPKDDESLSPTSSI